MSEALKPCPFCGKSTAGTATELEGDGFSVECFNIDCIVEGPYDDTREGAIAKWNKRVGEGKDAT